LRSGSKYCCCCCVLPKRSRSSMLPVSGALQLNTCRSGFKNKVSCDDAERVDHL
jgi:hypothetical protein